MEEKKLQRIRESIKNRTGIPADLLNGETLEENIAQAKALLAFKKEQGAEDPEQSFLSWFRIQTGQESSAETLEADVLRDINGGE